MAVVSIATKKYVMLLSFNGLFLWIIIMSGYFTPNVDFFEKLIGYLM